MGGLVINQIGCVNVCYIVQIYGLDFDYVEVFCCWLVSIDEYFDMLVGIYLLGMCVCLNFVFMFVFDFDIYLIDEGML